MFPRVKLILSIRGIKQKDIARALNLNPATVSQVVAGKRRSRRIENYIAQITGIKREELFGEKAA